MAAPGVLEKAVERLMELLPPRLAGQIDLRRPSLAVGFGPFNGQERRDAIVRSLLTTIPFDLVIETGTYRGTTTQRLRTLTEAPIVTIEASSRYHEYSSRRLARLPSVEVIHGDSATTIRRLASAAGHDRSARVFAYLDAHWETRLPARYEILELLGGWDQFCAVIDDFKVPGDPGYAFDDYGPGAVLDETLFGCLPLDDAAMFYPQVPSVDETGYRRGWIVVARGGQIVERLRMLDGLTPATG